MIIFFHLLLAYWNIRMSVCSSSHQSSNVFTLSSNFSNISMVGIWIKVCVTMKGLSINAVPWDYYDWPPAPCSLNEPSAPRIKRIYITWDKAWSQPERCRGSKDGKYGNRRAKCDHSAKLLECNISFNHFIIHRAQWLEWSWWKSDFNGLIRSHTCRNSEVGQLLHGKNGGNSHVHFLFTRTLNEFINESNNTIDNGVHTRVNRTNHNAENHLKIFTSTFFGHARQRCLWRHNQRQNILK